MKTLLTFEISLIFNAVFVRDFKRHFIVLSITRKGKVILAINCATLSLIVNSDLKIWERSVSATADLTEGEWGEVAVARRQGQTLRKQNKVQQID